MITLALAADNNYAMPLAVVLSSIDRHLDARQDLSIYILDGGITPENKEKIIQGLDFQKRHITLTWLNPQNLEDGEILSNLKIDGHVTVVTYYRLLLPYLLPKTLEKVIYLDSDLLICSDLTPLWETDISHYPLCAVQDMGAPLVSSQYGLKNYQELGLNPQWKYFNAGVMVLNLQRWREERIAEKVMSYLQEQKDFVRWWDQDGLNAVLAGQWGELDPRWNQIPHIFYYQQWQDSPFSQEVYQAVSEHPWIIHYATKNKPWVFKVNFRPNEILYYEYVDRTAWKGWRPKEKWSVRFDRYRQRCLSLIMGKK